MKPITDQIQEAIKAHELRNQNTEGLEKLQDFIDQIKKNGLDNKPAYSLPLTDTLGRSFYASYNKHNTLV